MYHITSRGAGPECRLWTRLKKHRLSLTNTDLGLLVVFITTMSPRRTSCNISRSTFVRVRPMQYLCGVHSAVVNRKDQMHSLIQQSHTHNCEMVRSGWGTILDRTNWECKTKILACVSLGSASFVGKSGNLSVCDADFWAATAVLLEHTSHGGGKTLLFFLCNEM